MTHVDDIRVMRPEEFAAVRALSMAAFGDDPTIGTLLDALRESWAWEDSLSFVAERDGEVVGHVLYTSAMLDTVDRLVNVLVLSPIGVRPDLHRQGIGGAMIRHSLDVIERTRPEPLVFLEGIPDYYPRYGFQVATPLGFRRPSLRTPAAAFMVFPTSRAEPSMAGTLVYPDAFWRTDSVGLRDGIHEPIDR